MKRFENTKAAILAVALLLAPVANAAFAQINTPPIYNHRVGTPPSCNYAAQGSLCGAACRCVATVQSVGWPCDGCSTPTGWWPGFAMLFYHHKGVCTSVDFNELPLLDLPTGLQAGEHPLIPNYNISILPIARLGRIREVPLECSPDRSPVDSAARYALTLGGFGSGADCNGAVFFITAEYNPALFEVTVHGRIRGTSTFNCASAALQPFQPRLIVGTEFATTNTLRYPNLISSPQYVKVGMKRGRSPREAGTESVKLRVHTFNWGGDHEFICEITGGCPEGYRFQQDGAANVQVFSLELPPNRCQDPPPLDPADALAISTISDAQRQSAEFDGFGAKTINDLTAELPTLRVGHNRFRAGRALDESLIPWTRQHSS